MSSGNLAACWSGADNQRRRQGARRAAVTIAPGRFGARCVRRRAIAEGSAKNAAARATGCRPRFLCRRADTQNRFGPPSLYLLKEQDRPSAPGWVKVGMALGQGGFAPDEAARPMRFPAGQSGQRGHWQSARDRTARAALPEAPAGGGWAGAGKACGRVACFKMESGSWRVAFIRIHAPRTTLCFRVLNSSEPDAVPNDMLQPLRLCGRLKH